MYMLLNLATIMGNVELAKCQLLLNL
jgi:hypothetical protein